MPRVEMRCMRITPKTLLVLLAMSVWFTLLGCDRTPATPDVTYVRGEGYLDVSEGWVDLGNRWIGGTLYSRHERRRDGVTEVRFMRLDGQRWNPVPKDVEVKW